MGVRAASLPSLSLSLSLSLSQWMLDPRDLSSGVRNRNVIRRPPMDRDALGGTCRRVERSLLRARISLGIPAYGILSAASCRSLGLFEGCQLGSAWTAQRRHPALPCWT